jgi:hypothetical protein
VPRRQIIGGGGLFVDVDNDGVTDLYLTSVGATSTTCSTKSRP